MARYPTRSWTNADGSTETRYVYRYTDSEGRRRSLQAKTVRALEAKIEDLRQRRAEGTWMPDRDSCTVDEAADLWLAASRRGRDGRAPVEASTAQQYRNHIENHLKPVVLPGTAGGEGERFGARLLSRLARRDIEQLRDALLDQGRSREMTGKLLVSLKGIFGHARSAGLMAGTPEAGVRIVADRRRAPLKRVAIPEPSEVKTILKKAAQLAGQKNKQRARWWRRYQAMVATVVSTGVRPSELRGAYKTDVDFRKGELKVQQRADEWGVLGPLKSAQGYRTLVLPKATLKLLRVWVLEAPATKTAEIRHDFGAAYVVGQLLFPNWSGHVESLGNIRRRGWVPLQEKAKVVDAGGKARYRFNAMRHYYASAQIAAGANAKELQVDMGHSSIEVTMDIYGHLFEERGEARRDRIEAMAAQVM